MKAHELKEGESFLVGNTGLILIRTSMDEAFSYNQHTTYLEGGIEARTEGKDLVVIPLDTEVKPFEN